MTENSGKEVSLAGVKPLTVKEADRLEKLEAVIQQNFKGFYAVGCALREIRDSQLYREKYSTFEDYCKDVWETCARSARRYIGAASAYETIKAWAEENATNWSHDDNATHGSHSENGTNWSHYDEPKNEAQVRHLTREELSPEDQIECWKSACERAAVEGRKVTAYYVEQAVVEFLGGRAKRQLKNTVRESNQANFPIEFNKALAPIISMINQAIENNWKGMRREKVIELIDNLRAIVAGQV
jgi:hypothetical protein